MCSITIDISTVKRRRLKDLTLSLSSLNIQNFVNQGWLAEQKLRASSSWGHLCIFDRRPWKNKVLIFFSIFLFVIFILLSSMSTENEQFSRAKLKTSKFECRKVLRFASEQRKLFKFLLKIIYTSNFFQNVQYTANHWKGWFSKRFLLHSNF